MLLAAVLAGCLLAPVPADLQETFCRASWAWLPYRATVTVRWCQGAEECARLRASGGGLCDMRTRTIVLSNEPVPIEVMDPAYWGIGRVQELYLIMLHEYGHALGLDHKSMGIMRSGWDVVVPDGPSSEDFEELRRQR
jgi:hypothetical protein